MSGIRVPEYGAFVLDPGGSSGVCQAKVKDEGTVAERLAAAEIETFTISHPDWMEQVLQISHLLELFSRRCEKAGLPAYLVCEDFILTRLGSSDRLGLYPVWIAAALVGYLTGVGGTKPKVVWQQPSAAKGYATDERLKRWGLWIKGRDHERDACRHLAYFVAHTPSQRMRASRERMRARA